MEEKYAVGVDVGGTHISSVVVNLEDGKTLGNPLLTDIAHDAPAENIFSAWTRNLRQTLGEAGVEVRHVGMAFPGPFDYENGVSFMDHKFVSIKGLNVGQILQARLLDFQGLEFRYINDAGAFSLGESLFGAAAHMDKVLILTLGTGLGSGFVRGHEIIREGEGVPAGGEVWDLPFKGKLADEMFSTRWIVGRFKELTGKDVQGAKAVAIRCPFDPVAREVFDEFGAGLAEFAVPVMEKFGTRNLVLGGNISRSLDLFLPAMTRRFGQLGADVNVKSSSLFDNAALLGAASLFM